MQPSKPDAIAPPPEVWDFRSVRKEEAEEAVRYEYSRESKAVISQVIKWRSTVIGSLLSGHPWERKELGSHADWPVKRLLARFDKLPQEKKNIITRRTPIVALNALGPLIWRFPEFPNPFLRIDPQTRLDRIRAMREEVAGSAEVMMKGTLWIRNDPYPATLGEISWRQQESQRGVRYYTARVDWSKGKAAIKAAFEKWIVKQKPPVPWAKVASDPWTRLKWLAAHRLHDAGFKFNKAQVVCQIQLCQKPGDEFNAFLPKYSSPASWGNALINYRNFRRELLRES
jgi:hypothetical protein